MVYNCALKNTYLNPQKNVEIMKTVIPELNTFHSMLHIRDIDDRKATDEAKKKKKAEERAALGLSEEEEEELKLDLPEPKINKKGKKIEHDPELVEEARIRALFKRELERYGVSFLYYTFRPLLKYLKVFFCLIVKFFSSVTRRWQKPSPKLLIYMFIANLGLGILF